ncbi:hypothetical protein PV327_001846 [Microctonus hyperodae]|uniref:Uncharacterized protein n=1 Tax=Microctonus hyperodae TaxID=165561 RepID=A0AA39FED4_MICHY|nr:hypothetical protein PV327_001846 [Microctonus hyperodae]
MKFVYVGIVVLGCMLQILIGSSHELLNASTPQPTTLKPAPEYRWVEYNKFSYILHIRRLLLVQSDSENPQYLIIRLKYDNGDIVPYEGRQKSGEDKITPEPEIDNYKQFEVFQIEPDHYKWVQSSNGTVEKNAIEGGQINNKTVYICRMETEFGHTAGVMQPSDHSCYMHGYSDDLHRTKYELLTYV